MFKPGEKEPYDPGRYSEVPMTDHLMEIMHDQGYGSLVYSYEVRLRFMYLSELDVGKDFRGHGVAKNLLRYSKELSETLGAKLVIAAITTREAYEATAAIYGEEHMQVTKLGSYMAPDAIHPEYGLTLAMLHYEPNSDVGQ